MTTHEHIKELIAQAEIDYGAAEALNKAGFYSHALFWAHLVLEKLCKALWIRRNENVTYPYIHNLLRLLKDSKAALTKEQIGFYSDMNRFHSKGRYTGELKEIKITVTKEICESYLVKTEKEMQWLKQQLQ